MDRHLPKGLPSQSPSESRPRPRRRNRLRLVTDTQVIEVQDIWSDGFAIARSGPQPKRGYVDLLDDGELLRRGLIYPNGTAGEQNFYAFKRAQDARLDPPRDYAGTQDPA